MSTPGRRPGAGSSSGCRAGWRRTGLVLLALHFALSSLAFFAFGGYRNQPSKIESDGKYYYQFLLSLWFDRDLDFSNNYAMPPKPFMTQEVDHYGFAGQLTPTGLPANVFTIGPAVLWVPFFAASYEAGTGLARLGAMEHEAPDGWERYFQYSVMFSAVLYSTLTLALLFDLLIPYFSTRSATASLAFIFWGSNWLYYCVFEPSMSHVYDLFTLTLLLWACLRGVARFGLWGYALVGLAAGLQVLVRPQNLITVAILLLILVVPRRSVTGQGVPLRIRWRGVAVLSSTFVVAVLPLAISNTVIFGKVLVVPQRYAASVNAETPDVPALPQRSAGSDSPEAERGRGHGFLRVFSPQFGRVLFSGRNGLFSHHPFLLMAVPGWLILSLGAGRHRKAVRDLLLPLGLVFLVQLWINSSTSDWWGGHAFGQRRLVSSLPLFAVGFAALYQLAASRLAHGRGIMAVLTATAILMNVYLTGIHVFLWSYDEPHNILEWTFVRAPRLIGSWLTG